MKPKFKIGDRVVLTYKIDRLLEGLSGIITSQAIESKFSGLHNQPEYFYYFVKLDNGLNKSPAEYQMEFEDIYHSELYKALKEG